MNMGEVRVEKKDDDFRVEFPAGGGLCSFLFSEVIAAKGDITALLATTFTDEAGAERTFELAISAMSSSSREAYGRLLKKCLATDGKDAVNWDSALSVAVTKFRSEYRRTATDGILTADQILLREPSFLLEPFLELGVANMIYAKASTGKTYFALDLALALATGTQMFGAVPDAFNPPVTVPILFLDWENSAETYRYRLSKLGGARGGYTEDTLRSFHYKDTKGVPLYEMADAMAEYVKKKGIGLVIIDSAAPACGGPPEESGSVTRYFAAVRKLGVTTLTIAHEPKGEGSGDTPFGSVFWVNLSRNVWRLVVDFQQESVRELTLWHKKFNNGPLRKPMAISMKHGLRGMEFTVTQSAKEVSLEEKIVARLRDDGEMTAAQLAKAEDVHVRTVSNLLTVMKKKGSVKQGDTFGKVRLATADDLKK